MIYVTLLLLLLQLTVETTSHNIGVISVEWILIVKESVTGWRSLKFVFMMMVEMIILS